MRVEYKASLQMQHGRARVQSGRAVESGPGRTYGNMLCSQRSVVEREMTREKCVWGDLIFYNVRKTAIAYAQGCSGLMFTTVTVTLKPSEYLVYNSPCSSLLSPSGAQVHTLRNVISVVLPSNSTVQHERAEALAGSL